jgi:hypothetical protein
VGKVLRGYSASLDMGRGRLARLKIIIVLSFCSIFLIIPSVVVSQSVTKPSITLPSFGEWYLDIDITYPTADYGEHDPEGCGRLTYASAETGSIVSIMYENAMDVSWSAGQLQDEAFDIFERDYGEYFISDYGTWNVAYTSAGYTKGSNYGIEIMVVTLAKNNVFICIDALNFGQDGDNIWNMINSLEVASASQAVEPDFNTYLIIGLIAAAVAVAIIAIFFLRKRKPKDTPKMTTVKFDPVVIHN